MNPQIQNEIDEVAPENPGIFESMKRIMVEQHWGIVEEAIDWREFSW